MENSDVTNSTPLLPENEFKTPEKWPIGVSMVVLEVTKIDTGAA
jgi:hypothetical protein